MFECILVGITWGARLDGEVCIAEIHLTVVVKLGYPIQPNSEGMLCGIFFTLMTFIEIGW